MSLYWIFGAIFLLLLTGLMYWAASRAAISKRGKQPFSDDINRASGSVESSLSKSDGNSYLGHDLVAVDQYGKTLIRTSIIDNIPLNSSILADNKGVIMERVKYIASQIFKDVSTLPSKTVELVFDPHIQQGLLDGTLEIMPAIGGGDRLIARNVGNKSIAGHGRVLDGGRVRQISTGAFHVLSIAVAQSHLDDINRSLSEIKNAVEGVKHYLDNKDKSRLKGTILYLEYLVSFMSNLSSPEKIPSEKRNQLEAIRRESMEWAEQLRGEFFDLKSKINAQQDVDTLGGTENTFNALKSHAESTKNLIEKRSLLLRIMVLLEVGSAYLDPLGVDEPSKVFRDDSERDMEEVESLLLCFRDRSNQLLSRAIWNKNTTLNERRDNLISHQADLTKYSNKSFQDYFQTTKALDQHFQRMRKNNQEIRMALSYDQNGDVKQVALL